MLLVWHGVAVQECKNGLGLRLPFEPAFYRAAETVLNQYSYLSEKLMSNVYIMFTIRSTQLAASLLQAYYLAVVKPISGAFTSLAPVCIKSVFDWMQLDEDNMLDSVALVAVHWSSVIWWVYMSVSFRLILECMHLYTWLFLQFCFGMQSSKCTRIEIVV